MANTSCTSFNDDGLNFPPASSSPFFYDSFSPTGGGPALVCVQSDEDNIGGNRWIGVHDRS
jgi:hypothetical protein